mmetsp:Transcript_58000/g.131422  ORF Transcript_58000/g.131422 Transcript_58000/m.131422 type:complete len:202 (-) Transcript_58000:82-687(-)
MRLSPTSIHLDVPVDKAVRVEVHEARHRLSQKHARCILAETPLFGLDLSHEAREEVPAREELGGHVHVGRGLEGKRAPLHEGAERQLRHHRQLHLQPLAIAYLPESRFVHHLQRARVSGLCVPRLQDVSPAADAQSPHDLQQRPPIAPNSPAERALESLGHFITGGAREDWVHSPCSRRLRRFRTENSKTAATSLSARFGF